METYQIFAVPQASVPSDKYRNNKDDASITSAKTNVDTSDKGGKSGKKWLRNPTYIYIRKK